MLTMLKVKSHDKFVRQHRYSLVVCSLFLSVLGFIVGSLEATAQNAQDSDVRSPPTSDGREATVIVDAAWEPDRVISPRDGHLQCVQFSQGGSLVSVSGDRLIQTFSPHTGELERVYEGATDEVIRFDFSPDEQLVAGGLGDGNVLIWNARTTEVIAKLTGHGDQIIGVQFSPDGRWLASTAAFHDGTVRIWDTTSWNQVASAKTAPRTNGMFLAWSPNSKRIASSEYRGGVRLYSFEDAELRLLFSGNHDDGEMVSHVCFAPDGQTFVTSSWDRTLRCWDAEDGRQIWQATAPKYARCFDASLFSPDGNRIYSVTRDETIEMRDAKDGTLLLSRRWLDSAVRGFAISEDGKQVATCGHDRQLKVWTLN